MTDFRCATARLDSWAMQPLRVDTAAVQATAARWRASVGEPNATAAPAGLGLSCQASAAAVSAAHADVTAFTAALAKRVGTRATRVVEADGRYIANEADEPAICVLPAPRRARHHPLAWRPARWSPGTPVRSP